MWELEEVAALFGVSRGLIQQWLRQGLCEFKLRRRSRFSVVQVIPAEEVIKLVNVKFKSPGDGSETAAVWQHRINQRKLAALARWAKVKGQVAGSPAPQVSDPISPTSDPTDQRSEDQEQGPSSPVNKSFKPRKRKPRT